MLQETKTPYMENHSEKVINKIRIADSVTNKQGHLTEEDSNR